MSEIHTRRYRSLFWPILLIGVGCIWLMANLGLLPGGSVWLLPNLWPVILIGIGIDLVFGRQNPAVGAAASVLLIVGVVAFLFYAPALNLNVTKDLQTRTITVPLEKNQNARVSLDLASYPTTIQALPAASPDVLDATLHYRGAIDFSATGSNGVLDIRLSHRNSENWWMNMVSSGDQSWQIGLHPNLPLDMTINAASGSSDIDLSGLQLTRLKMDAASGSTTLNLPASQKSYPVDYNGASGSAEINLPAATSITLTLNGASGSISVNLPANAAARVEVKDNGSGSVSINNRLTRLEGQVGKDMGVWETPGYASAANKILVLLNGVGSGSINVH
jgi:hypothetical protein